MKDSFHSNNKNVSNEVVNMKMLWRLRCTKNNENLSRSIIFVSVYEINNKTVKYI